MGCTPATEADVFFDNTTEKVLVYYVDGKPVAKVPPNHFRKASIKLGEHVFTVRHDGDEIYKERQTLEAPKSGFRNRYVLNPDLDARYCSLTFIYGDDTASKAATDAVVKTIAWIADKELDESDETMMEFERLRNDAKPMPKGGWFRVPSGIRVLQPLPSYVVSRNMSERRTTLIRIPDEAHSYLTEAMEQKTASTADIAMMEDILWLLEELVEVE